MTATATVRYGAAPMPTTTRSESLRLTRRVFAAALPAAALVAAARLTVAQDEPAADTVVPVAPESATIVSTGRGEVPSFGGRRPGPFDQPPLRPLGQTGVEPVGLRIDKIGVDAGIEPLQVVDGQMQDPTGPWTVAWYENLGALGEGGNVVMAGHIDYWNVGPSVFYDLAALEAGDGITVFGEDGEEYAYAVEWLRQYDAANAPLDEIVGSDGQESLTLITCGGTFDYQNAHYLQRTVVRAARQA